MTQANAGHQYQQMMVPPGFNPRGSPRGHEMHSSDMNMYQGQGLGIGVHQQAMTQGYNVRVDVYPQGMTESHCPPMQYGSQMQPHDPQMMQQYNHGTYVMQSQQVVHMGTRGYHGDMRNPRMPQSHNPNVSRMAQPMGAARGPPQDIIYSNANVIQDFVQSHNVVPSGHVGVMQHNQMVDVNANYNAVNNYQYNSGQRGAPMQHMHQGMDMAAGKNIMMQGVEQTQQHYSQNMRRVPYHPQQGIVTMGHMGGTMPQYQGIPNPNMVPRTGQEYTVVQNKTHIMGPPPQMKESPVQKPTAKPMLDVKAKGIPPNYMHMAHNKPVSVQVIQQGNAVNKNAMQPPQVSQQEAGVSQNVKSSTPVPGVDYSKTTPDQKTIVHQPPVAPPVIKQVFTMHNNWEIREPEQMLFFDMTVTETGYKHLVNYMDSLQVLNKIPDPPKRNTFELPNSNEMDIVKKDKLNFKADKISDAIILKLIEKLKSLKCALIKKGGMRKLIQKNYPERNSIIYSAYEDHELNVFVGSTTVDKGVILPLYHKVKCEHNPTFLCGRENRKYNVAVEKTYSIYSKAKEHNIEIVLLQVSDLDRWVYHIAFGTRVDYSFDFIMELFKQPSV
ncbi:hypothetical protein BaOVIS_021840 [Babesia ovis]|uniref:Uncharacterized protein n=1 Tax=Babesia ovis TaxID=5869 RepID=A0A9W5WV84_BABOV|nr:hypothetical protein BaOVIS_021840 [Babesia ovis]